MLANARPLDLPRPPDSLLTNASLFLDFDGTLVEIADSPDAVVVEEALIELIEVLIDCFPGRVAIISGRSIEQLDRLLGAVAQKVAVSGSHGNEHRWNGIHAHPKRPPELEEATQEVERFAAGYKDLLVEPKSYGVALHYRRAPDLESEVRVFAHNLSVASGLTLQHGKMMTELRVTGGDKGQAIKRLMARAPMSGSTPIFLGDDDTDEPAFAAVAELGGAGILVGDIRQTAARYMLPDVAAVRRWLHRASA